MYSICFWDSCTYYTGVCVGARLSRDFIAKIAEIQSDLSRESLWYSQGKEKNPFQNVLSISSEQECFLFLTVWGEVFHRGIVQTVILNVEMVICFILCFSKRILQPALVLLRCLWQMWNKGTVMQIESLSVQNRPTYWNSPWASTSSVLSAWLCIQIPLTPHVWC